MGVTPMEEAREPPDQGGRIRSENFEPDDGESQPPVQHP